MFKQQPIKYIYKTIETEFKSFRMEDDTYVYGRKLEVEVLNCHHGFYISIDVVDLRSNEQKGNHEKKIANVVIYDKDMNKRSDMDTLGALGSGDIRGKYAENLIYNLIITYGKNTIKEYLPLLYNYLLEQNIVKEGE